MILRPVATTALWLALLVSLPIAAQSPPPRDSARAMEKGLPLAADPFGERLDRLLQQSRAGKRRVVLFMHGQEIAGVVLEIGPGWVVLSNQEDQEILLRTHDVERAEFR